MQVKKSDEPIMPNIKLVEQPESGRSAGRIFKYNACDQLAFEVVDKMLAQGWQGFSLELSCWQNPQRQWLATFFRSKPIEYYSAKAATRVEAICLAAIAAMEVDEDRVGEIRREH